MNEETILQILFGVVAIFGFILGLFQYFIIRLIREKDSRIKYNQQGIEKLFELQRECKDQCEEKRKDIRAECRYMIHGK